MDTSNKRTFGVIAESLLLMAVLQAVRIFAERIAAPLLPDSEFARRMTTMCVMAVLAGAVILYARARRTPFSIFPERFGKGYVIFTVIVAALMISTPSNYTGGYQAILLLIYSSIVTPVYEELIFRGYLWNRLNTVMQKEIYTCIFSVVFFMVWHLGYIIPQIIGGNAAAVIGKLAAGLGYGVVLGFIRIKTKNVYPTILSHGVMNLFMI